MLFDRHPGRYIDGEIKKAENLVKRTDFSSLQRGIVRRGEFYQSPERHASQKEEKKAMKKNEKIM